MLTVETGAGLEEADAYISVEELRADAALRGVDLTASSDEKCEIALRLAAQWIDTFARYKGVKLVAMQEREFPRDGLVDWSGFAVSGVPKRIKRASAELAERYLQGVSLAPDVDRSNFVKSESVGPISTTYADDAPTIQVFTIVERLLEPYIRDKDQQWAPFSGGSEVAAFEVGMMSNHGTVSLDD